MRPVDTVPVSLMIRAELLHEAPLKDERTLATIVTAGQGGVVLQRPRQFILSTDGGANPGRAAYVEKIRVPARVSQPNLEPRDGWFLLFPRVEHSARPETLLELLNSQRVVVPFIQADDAAVLLLTRVNIDWIVVGRDVDTGLVHPAGRVTTEQRVDLRLIDESHVHAVFQWDSADGTVRLSDFLDASGDFLVAKTGFGLLLANRLRIRETRLAESTPRPVADVADSDPRAAA